MYTPRPLPTMAPSFSPYENMFDMVDYHFSKIIDMFASVPVIPNSNGLFDPATGEWYPPALSFLDVLIAVLVIGTFFTVIMKLSQLGSNITGGLINHAKNH